MRPSGTITLFSERPQSSPPTASVVISILAHGAVIGLVALGLVFRPRVVERPLAEHFDVRRLDLHMPDPPKMRSQAAAGIDYPGPLPDAPAPSARSAVARQVAQLTPAPQTLLQPKLRHLVLKEKVPVPNIVIWKTESTPNAVIVPPLPKKTMAVVVQPSVDPPNEELNLDKLAISSSLMASKTQPILPSNTSPVVVQAPQPAPEPPQTTSKSTAPPTPASVVSLSDLRAEGKVVLPAANQTASAASSGVLAPGRPEDLAKADNGTADRGSGASNNASGTAAGAKPDTGKGGQGREQGARAGQDAKGSLDLGSAIASASSGAGSVERIALPKDGQFGVVVVGSSLEEMFPEAGELWGGRLAYTVYVHVGLSKSWILQYALPPASDAAAGGNATHLAAPWPYTIIRPNLALGDLNADALMVHGIVSAAGRFEALAIAFPPKYEQADFVLSSLRQWEFRPATQGGKPTAVEVLLIIPEESE